jgi:hypothetical protein
LRHSLLSRLETGALHRYVWVALAITAAIVLVGGLIVYWLHERPFRVPHRR